VEELAWVGVVLFAVGAAGSLAVQAAMGASWRVGVADGERTELVADGIFGIARNPFFTALTLTAIGLTVLVGNVVALLSLLALVTAIQLQVRVVEESYLSRAHGARYLDYAARVGRFVPHVGRLRPEQVQ
jgi:protein-S-isoprenylcysteine O-methyltransferase Ste14